MLMPDFNARLSSADFCRDPFIVAPQYLLGAYLCSRVDGVFTAGKITECEVYLGGIDKAAHSYGYRRTPRTEIQYQPGGKAYVTLVYGMYNQFNVTVSGAGEPDCILIRSLEPVAGIEVMQNRRGTSVLKNLTTGPGKLCQALGIDFRRHYGADLCGETLWISPRGETPPFQTSPRIGIDYAGEFRDKPWRYFIAGNPFVSKLPRR